MNILVDAMGGDNAPDAVIKGAVKAAKEIDGEITLIGITEVINSKVKEFYGKDSIEEVASNIKIYHTTECIEMEDIPIYYESHYSNSVYVCHYLTRIFPYSI